MNEQKSNTPRTDADLERILRDGISDEDAFDILLERARTFELELAEARKENKRWEQLVQAIRDSIASYLPADYNIDERDTLDAVNCIFRECQQFKKASSGNFNQLQTLQAVIKEFGEHILTMPHSPICAIFFDRENECNCRKKNAMETFTRYENKGKDVK